MLLGETMLKVLYVGLNLVLQSNFKILETFFFTSPSSSDLTHVQDARLTTPTGTSAHDDELN